MARSVKDPSVCPVIVDPCVLWDAHGYLSGRSNRSLCVQDRQPSPDIAQVQRRVRSLESAVLDMWGVSETDVRPTVAVSRRGVPCGVQTFRSGLTRHPNEQTYASTGCGGERAQGRRYSRNAKSAGRMNASWSYTTGTLVDPGSSQQGPLPRGGGPCFVWRSI